jgi:glycosyltransferase involved in cell wall biosynthesis
MLKFLQVTTNKFYKFYDYGTQHIFNMTQLNKKLSIITVTLNAVDGLVATLSSVSNQKRRGEIEFVVIDGFSNDGSIEYLEKNRHEIDVFVSSKDLGVYDAMNKGIQQSTGEWLYFLNAGDVFLDNDSLTRVLDEIDDGDVLYSDVLVDKNGAIYKFETSFDDRKLNHQGFVYRKELHEQFGPYAVIRGFTAADYFFFLQLDGLKVKKLTKPIAIFQLGGLSSTVKAVRQKYCLDFLSGKISALNLAARLIIYPMYRVLKKIFC